jgi:hypothetical protein
MSVYNVPVEVLASHLDAELAVWVRIAATRMDGDWVVRLLEVTTGEPPPGWEPLRWEYRDALFFAVRRKGTTPARWLRARRAVLGSHRLSFREMSETASWDRRESLWSGGIHGPLGWPSEVCRLNRTENLANPFSELIGMSSPSFASFETAASCLLGVELTGWNLSGNEFVVRRQDALGVLILCVIAAQLKRGWASVWRHVSYRAAT